jgi:uncharacterized membrane protein
MADRELNERLAIVETRVKHLECLLGVLEPKPASPAVVTVAGGWDDQPRQAAEPYSLEDDDVQILPPNKIGRFLAQTSNRSTAAPPPIPSMHPLPNPDPTPVIPKARLTSIPAAKDTALEQTIGLKWTGWIGAVVLVIGVAFGIKFGYEQGWFGFVTPAVRVTMMALGGFALLAAGEFVYRRVNRLSAAGLFGAGVAVLFVVSYAGYAFYLLYGRDAAFVCMGLSTIIGTLVARRGGLVSIAVLSMIGGNLAPVLLRSDQPNLGGFLTYLLLLQLTSLAMSAWGASPRWWTLRGLSLATTSLWVLAVMHIPPRELVMFFALIFAVAYQAELVFSARRSMWGKASAGVTFSMLVTAGLTALMLGMFADAPITFRVAGVLSLAGAVAALTVVCWRMARDAAALRFLAVGYAMQAIALLVVAAPIALSGVWISAAWCVLAIVLATAGYVLDLKTPRVAALAIWGLAVGDLMMWSGAWDGRPTLRVFFPLIGTEVPQYVFAAWGLAIGAQIIAGITRKRRHEPASILMQQNAQWVSCAGVLLWVAASIAGLPLVDSSIAMLVLGWILLIGGQLEDSLNLRLQGGILFYVTAMKWVIADTLLNRFSPGWTAGAQPPLLTMNVAAALVLAGSLWSFAFTTRKAQGLLANFRTIFHSGAACVLVLVWAGTMEIDRSVEHFVLPGSLGISLLQWKQLLWTSWWMICSCVPLVAAAWIGRNDTSRAAMLFRRWWKLPAWITAKFLLLDLLVYRVISEPAVRPLLAGPIPIAAGVVMGALGLLYWLSRDSQLNRLLEPQMRPWIVSLAVAGLFIVGSLGIDQVFMNLQLTVSMRPSEAGHAEQVGLSVFWSAFAVIAVIAGFIWQAPPLRYFSLTLFAIVLLKVVTVDLSQVSTGWRILSFVVLGLLLLGTSVLYGKLSPKLVGQPVQSNE